MVKVNELLLKAKSTDIGNKNPITTTNFVGLLNIGLVT